MKNNIQAKLCCLIAFLFCFSQVGKCIIYAERDFSGNTNFDYDFGTWTGNITPGASFITINTGTNGSNGGAGFGFAPEDITLTPAANTYLVIRARLLSSHNPANPIQLSLGSSPTDYSVWSIPASAFNTTTFTTVLVSIATTPVFTEGTLNLAAVTNFQVQGNYGNRDDFDIEIEYMAIIPEPHQVAAATLLLLGLVLRWRKRLLNSSTSSEVL